jgi:hypothetical protein
MVPESHPFPAQAIQIRGAQKAGAQMGHEIGTPLVNNDQENIFTSRHARASND